jgi:hypothetical protein
MMANWPWTPEGEEELLDWRFSRAVAVGSEKARQTEAAVVGRAGVLKAKQAEAKKE